MSKKTVRKEEIKIEEAINNWKRAVADYQNLEKRVVEERVNLIKTANRDLIARLLPVLDTLMLASTHIKNEGLELAIKQFIDLLKNEGVERIETEGKEFDPRVMECVETDPSAGSGQEGRVLEEIRAGYTLYGSVLRPAQIRVVKANINEKEEALAKEQLTKGDYM